MNSRILTGQGSISSNTEIVREQQLVTETNCLLRHGRDHVFKTINLSFMMLIKSIS